MKFSSVFWSPDHNYSSQISNAVSLVDSSITELRQTQEYISRTHKIQTESVKQIVDLVETSYATRARTSYELVVTSPGVENSTSSLPIFASSASSAANSSAIAASSVTSASFVSAQSKESTNESKNRSLAANYEVHVDVLSDIGRSRSSLANQIESKILIELSEFVSSYESFSASGKKVLESNLSNYEKLVKQCAAKSASYTTKCKKLEEFDTVPVATAHLTTSVPENDSLKPFKARSAAGSNTGSPHQSLQVSSFQSISRSISNAISRQNSDEEFDSSSEDESDPQEAEETKNEKLWNSLQFPIVLGNSTFKRFDTMQDFCVKLYNGACQLERNIDSVNKQASYFIDPKNAFLQSDSPLTISNIEIANWLVLNRSKSENSIRAIELFGQAMLNLGLLKIPMFKNSLFSSIMTPKFQASDENSIVVYEFTEFFNFLRTFNIEQHNITKQQIVQRKMQKKLQRQELKKLNREKKTSSTDYKSVPDYYQDLKNSQVSTPVNRSRTVTLSESKPLPTSTSTNGLTNYLSSQLKSLSIIKTPEASGKKKDSLKSQAAAAETALKQSVADLYEAKKVLESQFAMFLENFESLEKKKSQVMINSLNYLSFLLMKQSEYEFKKFGNLNHLISQSNNQAMVDRELQTILNQGSLFYYSPFTSFKFEKNDIMIPNYHKDYIARVSLFGTDVSLLPQYNDPKNLVNFSVSVFLNEFLDKLYNTFLVNYDDQYNNDTLRSPVMNRDAPDTGLLELGNFARTSWTAPFNIVQAYDNRSSAIKQFESIQELELEAIQEELNSIAKWKNKNEFQEHVAKKLTESLFSHNSLEGLVSLIKLWLLELPDSLVPFTVFDKLKSLYFEAYEKDTEKGKDDRIDKIIKLLSTIPRSNLACLYALASHVSNVSSMGFNSYSRDKEQFETFKLVQSKFIEDLASTEGEYNIFPFCHLIVRNTTKASNSKAPLDPRFQFFYKTLTKDLLDDVMITKMKMLIIERESTQQKSLKVKKLKEKESIQLYSANNSPSLSRSNINKFDSSEKGHKATDSVSSVGSQNSVSVSTPTVMVEGLALRSFGTKNRNSTGFAGSPAVQAGHKSTSHSRTPSMTHSPKMLPKIVTTGVDPQESSSGLASGLVSGEEKRARRRSFSLLNGSGIQLVTDDAP